jgi:type III restriction enzyme
MGRYDFGLALNREERALAETLDDAEFIGWWRRNPDRKP